MTAKKNLTDGALLRQHIDELTAVQSSIQQLHQELAQLRNETRTDGFNMEAVHTLAQIVAKSPHDGGLGLLQDIITYAHKIGIEIDTVGVEVDATANDDNTIPGNDSASAFRRETVQTSIDTRLVLLIQLGLGLGVAWMFITLLG